MIAVEYEGMHPFHYDGVSEFRCMDESCGFRLARWCGKKLSDGESEPAKCNGKQSHNPSLLI
jgi:hypothetical protein